MSQTKLENSSPFAALSYQEQQDRWMEWRSRQLEYHAADEMGQDAQEEKVIPPLKIPNMRIGEPTRHRELDKVLMRHQQAFRHAGQFHAMQSCESDK